MSAPTVAARVEVLRSTDALESLVPEWRALAEQRENPFVSPEWFFAWLRHGTARGMQPFVPVVRRPDGALQGLLPLVLTRSRGYGTLAFAGADLGDYFHPVATASEEQVVAQRAAEALARHRGEWAILVADYVDEAAPWIASLAGSRSLRMRAVPYHGSASPYHFVRLEGSTWEGYLASRSANLRGQLRRKLRDLERAHEIVFRAAHRGTDISGELGTLFGLHLKRWRSRATTSFEDDHARAVLTDVAVATAARGWLRLWFLDVDGRSVAGWCGWRIGDRYLYYQAGFDPDWSARSPGLLLFAHTIRAAIEEGAHEYDMLLGGEAYKTRFATGTRWARTLVMTRRLHPATALVAGDAAARSLVRRLPEPLRARLRQVLGPAAGRWPIRTAP